MTSTDHSNAAIHYAADGYRFDKKIMGRQSAGMGFLKTLCQHGQLHEVVGWCNNAQAALDFSQDVKLYADADVHSMVIGADNIQQLSDIGTLYTPGPDLSPLAWQRTSAGSASWSLCGVTHTTCSSSVMNSIISYLSSPLQPWDALVCTSQAAKEVVINLLDEQERYLAQSLGAQTFTRPQLPVIPLGVDCESFRCTSQQRQQARARLNIPKGDMVVLYAGRLSFHAKAHPLPMYLALQTLTSKYQVHIVHFGVFSNTGLEKGFKDGAQALCPDVTCHWLDGSVDVNHALAWHSADVFCSLADNIQETFGLTPIEAMAAGLPVVVSDWNGYKDTVRHEVDGFRVTTSMPAANSGLNIAQRYHMGIDNFDYYIGHTSQFVGVDIPQCRLAFEALFSSPSLRHKMGQSGQLRAKEVYDWPVVIAQYQKLWHKLGELRKASRSPLDLKITHPSQPCPFSLYQSYPSITISLETSVQINTPVSAEELNERCNLAMNSFAKAVLPNEADCQLVLDKLEGIQGLIQVHQLAVIVGCRDLQKQTNLILILAWLHKQGWIGLEGP
jgi:starch synthase